MPDEHITTREFDGFAQSFRKSQDAMLERIEQVSSKLDMLFIKQFEEAKVMGELNSSLKAINERLERLEGESKAHHDDIDGLRARFNQRAEHKLGWYGQAVLAVLAAFIGAFLSKYYR